MSTWIKSKMLPAILMLLFKITMVFGQAPDTLSYPEVGKPMPDLEIRNIAYYPQKKATIRDFRGKWLLLDFWDIHCGACVRSFPRMNRIQQKFGKKLQVMMVGVLDPENKTQPLFAKYREGEHLTLPCAFDSGLAQRLDLFLMPHTIVIDEKGIVRSIVISIDTGQVHEFLNGNSPTLPQTYRRMKDYDTVVDRTIPFNDKKPFMVGGNGDSDSGFLYRSLLSIWSPNVQYRFPTINEAVKTGRFQVLGTPLAILYELRILRSLYMGARRYDLVWKML